MDDNIKVKAVYSFGLEGIEILDIIYDTDNSIVWRYTTDKKLHCTKIYYENRAYFKANNKRIYLDDCLRLRGMGY